MINYNSATRVRHKPHKFRRFEKRNKGSTRVIAVSLAFIMAFSAFGANISSIVHLLEAFAADPTYYNAGTSENPKYRYYEADLTLYDYKTNTELKSDSNSDNNAYDGENRNSVFNKALYESGYTDAVWNSGASTRWPLYLGLQFPGQTQGNQMIKDSGNTYHYSIVANSEAASGTSGAALGLVDSTLHGGDITQGGGKVILPYFDKEFLTAPLSSVLSKSTLNGEGLTSRSSTTLGSVLENQKFKFIKMSNGYYRYKSTEDALSRSGSTYTVGPGGTYYDDLSWSEHSARHAFFPWNYTSGHKGKFGYGAKFDIKFTMSSTGQTFKRDANGNVVINSTTHQPEYENDIKFTFSGDDDVWVFIDDHLVLDVGGAHGEVGGEIGFKKDEAYAKTNYIKTTGYNKQDGKASVAAGTPANGGIKYMDSLFQNTLHLYDDITKEHTLTVYYIERGSLESNCEITFNFQIADKVTVENKLSTVGVNSFFDDTLKAVTDTEAVEYVMASDSASTGLSPDTGLTDIDNSTSLYTLTFNPMNGVSEEVFSKTVREGETVVLPKGYNLTNEFGDKTYRIKGWSTSDADNRTVNTSSPYTVNSSHTLYAVWEEIPMAPLDKPNEPTLVFITSNAWWCTDWNVGACEPVYARHMFLGNLTGQDLSKNSLETKLTIKAGHHEWGDSDPGGANVDHPENASVTNNTNSYAQLSSNGKRIEFVKNGGFYKWEIDSSSAYSSTLDRYDDYEDFKANHSNHSLHEYDSHVPESADTWVENYYDLYNLLLTTYNTYKNTTNSTIRDAYNALLEKYYGLTYDPDHPDSDDSRAKEEKEALETAIGQFYVKYYYSDSTENVTFYVYSSSSSSSSSAPTVRSDNHFGNANYNDDNTDTRNYAGSPYIVQLATGDLPEGHSEPSGGNYYTITVPKYVMQQEYVASTNATSGNPSANDNNLIVTADGNTITKTAEEFSMMSVGDYPCWYAAKDYIQDITDSFPAYDFTTPKIFWVYSTSGAPSVTYTNTFTDNSTTVEGIHDSSDPDNYYYVKVYTKVTDGSTTQNTTISLNGATAVDPDTIFTSSCPVPCYYDTSSSAGWNNLVTMVVQPPSWWQNMQVYIGGGPLATAWDSPYQMKSINVNSNTYYYYFVPGSSSSIVEVLRWKESTATDNSAKSADITGVTADKYFHNPYNNAGDNNGIVRFGNTDNITSSSYSDFYPYTATAKSTSRLSGATSQPTRSIQIPVDPIEDDSDDDQKGDDQTQDDQTQDDQTQDDQTQDDQTQDDQTQDDQTQDDQTQDDSAQSTDSATDTPDSGTSGDGSGHFVGSNDGAGGAFTAVGGSGFKLYDPAFKKNTNGAQEYAVRRSDANGNYNLMFGQKAVFSYQFMRGSHLKVAETGQSYAFDTTAKKNGTTTTSTGSTPSFNSSSTAGVPLYNRYMTTYEIKDGVGNTANNDGENERYKAVDRQPEANLADYNALRLTNLDKSDSPDTGTELTVTYTNQVRTGSIKLQKKFTDTALAQIIADGSDPTFYFTVDFSEVFGGTANAGLYSGDYWLTDKDGNQTNPPTPGSGTVNSVTYTNTLFSFKFSDVYDKNASQYTPYAIEITGIPVYTKYTITESSDSGDYTLTDGSVKPGNTGATAATLTASSNSYSGKVTSTASSTTFDVIYTNTTGGTSTDADPDVQNVQYLPAEPDSSDFTVIATNDRPLSEAYLIITKTIDNFYYFTQQNDTDTDNPAGLATRSATVGGGASSTDDHNGYQDATKAEQSFLFKIEKFTSGPMFDNGEGHDHYNSTYGNSGSFVDYISFGPEDFAAGRKSKSIVLKVDPNATYLVSEITDWSWKYKPASTNPIVVSPQGALEGGDNGHNVVEGSYGQADTFNTTFSEVYTTLGTTREVNNAARITFNNEKDLDKKDVEGDTTVADNNCTVPVHDPLNGENLEEH